MSPQRRRLRATTQRWDTSSTGGTSITKAFFTAVSWIQQAIREQKVSDKANQGFDQVLLIRIRHVQPTNDVNIAGRPGHENGFFYAVAGPAKAMLTVRTASQVERGQIETNLLKRWLGDNGNPDQATEVNDSRINTVFVDYVPTDDMIPPLNWKLSPKEFATYEKAWRNFFQSKEMETIKKFMQL